MSQERVVLGVLFVDVLETQRLYAELGEEVARREVVRILDAAQQAVETAGGSIVDRIGDELMGTCPTAEATVSAAVGIQTTLRHARIVGGLPAGVRVRVGFHFGAVIRDGARIFGDTVHVARRVASLAGAERILTTRDTLRGLLAADQVPQRVFDFARLKGKPETFEIVEILWDERTATVENEFPNSRATGGTSRVLQLRHGATHRILDGANPVITIGRERCDVVVVHERVSRLHARIELRKNSFFLVDVSTNGTQVRGTSGVAIRVHRDELRLEDCGRLVLGMQDGADAPTLEFAIEAEGRRTG